jgi:outer membrane immunogenic protein
MVRTIAYVRVVAAIVLVLSADAALAQAVQHPWTGFYAGVNAGAGKSTGNSHNVCVNGGVANAAGCTVTPDTFNTQGTGSIYGIQAGYKHRLANGPWVVGVEADISNTSLGKTDSQSGTFPIVGGGANVVNARMQQQLKNLSTLTATAGYLANESLLLYAKGGLAYGRVHLEDELTLPLIGVHYLGTTTRSIDGKVFGVGAEYAVTRQISLRLEGLMYRFRDQFLTVPETNAPNPFHREANFQLTGRLLRFGVNYAF